MSTGQSDLVCTPGEAVLAFSMALFTVLPLALKLREGRVR